MDSVTTDVLPAVRPQPAVPLTPATPWQAVVAAYLDAAVDSANTRRAYARHLRDAFTALGVVATVDGLTGADLAAYRARVTASDLSPASQAQALAALRSFLAWAGTLG